MSVNPRGFLESQTGSHRLGMSCLWASCIPLTSSVTQASQFCPAATSSGLAFSPGMDPSRNYPIWYKNIVSLWILFGMAWLALIIKIILSQLETPGHMCACSLHCSKGNIKCRSWSGAKKGTTASSHQASRLEPSTQDMRHDEDS